MSRRNWRKAAQNILPNWKGPLPYKSQNILRGALECANFEFQLKFRAHSLAIRNDLREMEKKKLNAQVITGILQDDLPETHDCSHSG